MDDLLRSLLDPGEMTFTVEDADMDKLHEVLSDINVKDCPYFEIRDKYGNFAKYYREDHTISYDDCANAMLKMWMDNVLTDGEYNRIMDKLNKFDAERRTDGN